MRARSVPLGRPFGIRLRADLSWFPVALLVGLGTYATLGEAFAGRGTGAVAVAAVVTTLLFFASLTAHEMAHALLARRLGVPVRGITLFLFGGVSEIAGEVASPRDEFAIALVGPGTSVVLGQLFALGSVGADAAGLELVAGIGGMLAAVNAVLALFNLVPGLPLDGGRLLRATIWRRTGNHARSTRIASIAGRVVALGIFLTGVVRIATGDVYGLWFAFIALFLDGGARAADTTGPPGRQRAPAVALGDDEGPPAQPRP